MEKINRTVTKRIIRFKFVYFLCTLILYSQPSSAQISTDNLRIEALDHMEDGKFGEAINLLNRYITANPQNPLGYNLRGLCYENRKEYEKAVYDFRSALKLDPEGETIKSNLDRAVEKWEILLMNRIVGFKREIEVNPEKPVNYLEIGRCFKNLGNWDEAEAWYDEYLKREDPSADELIRYTEILAKNNHISKGESWLKKYTDKYPDDHRLWSRYGYFTMWLGKKQIAVEAFEKALEIRPYFKEALDGYDLARGRGYVYTVNDTTVRYNFGLPLPGTRFEYPIDKYYRKLIENPDDVQTRLLLAEELIKNDRFAEAEQQVQMLFDSKPEDERVLNLKNELSVKKESYHWQKTGELEKILSENPADEKSTIELALLYAEKKDFDKAINLLSGFKERFYISDKILYNSALINSWAGNLLSADGEIKKLLEKEPNNPDYQLLSGQLSVWLNKDLEAAQELLENVVLRHPQNFDALLSLSLLHLQKNELSKATDYLSKAKQINPDETEIKKIAIMIERQSKLSYQQELYSLLEAARNHLYNKECEKSIEFFRKYLESENSDPEIKKELAEAYMCKGDYTGAIRIYDQLVQKNPEDFEVLKQRAKLLYWSGNYTEAEKEFSQLVLLNPDDAETKLYLGDSYTALKDYSSARRIYSELLEISPSSLIIKNRMTWIEEPSAEGFPSYILLSPEANYYADNFDLLYSTYGLRFDFGVSDLLSLGISGYTGTLGSDSIKNNISIFKGTISTRFSDVVSAYVASGTTLFPDDRNSFIGEVSVQAEKSKIYSFTAGFYSMDAAQILYSPFLIDVRLQSNVLSLMGNYIFAGDWKFSGLYSFITVSDENNANKLQLRFGKIFGRIISTGYEYYYYDVKDQTTLYWSPENFESHSIWADWNIADNEEVKADLGGKLGYIPSEDFVLREFYGMAIIKLSHFFSVQARFTFSSTVQSGRGYSSTSFGISAFWNL